MDICFTKNGWEEFEYWLENDTDTAIKIKELIKSICENPFKGIGKPEPLQHDLKSFGLAELQKNIDWFTKFLERKVLIKNV